MLNEICDVEDIVCQSGISSITGVHRMEDKKKIVCDIYILKIV